MTRSRRVILLSQDRRVVLDVNTRRRSVTIANHTRLPRTREAPVLLAAAAAWLPIYTTPPLKFSAQNNRVAEEYIKQFPVLTRAGAHRRFGHVKLIVADPDQTPAAVDKWGSSIGRHLRQS